MGEEKVMRTGLLVAVVSGLIFSVSPILGSMAGILFPSIGAEYGWSRTALSGGVSACTLAIALATPFMGNIIQRTSPRRVVLTSVIIFSCLLVTFSQMPNNYLFFIGFLLILGFVGAGVTPFAYLSVLPQWFDRRLGMSLGIGMTGVGLGQTFLPIIFEFFNSTVGWRMTLVYLGIFNVLLVLPLGFLFYRNPPIRKTTAVADVRPHQRTKGLTLREARSTLIFWRMAIVFFLVSTVGAGCIVHISPMIIDRGYSGGDGAKILSVIGIAVMLSRLFVGILLDKIDATLIGIVCFLAASIGALLLIYAPNLMLLGLGAFMVGTGLGAEGDIMPFMLRRCFGQQHYPTIYGVFGGIYGAGSLFGPLILGISYDYLGGYEPGFYLFSALALVSALLLAGIEVPHSTFSDNDLFGGIGPKRLLSMDK